MSMISYKVGDIRRLVRESTLQYSPVKGPGVDADNKRNNEKSYKDAEKAAKDYDGGLQPEKKGALPDKIDGNRTTLDYNPRTEPATVVLKKGRIMEWLKNGAAPTEAVTLLLVKDGIWKEFYGTDYVFPAPKAKAEKTETPAEA